MTVISIEEKETSKYLQRFKGSNFPSDLLVGRLLSPSLFLLSSRSTMGPAEVAQGPMFIGVIFNVALYGIMVAQTYIYFASFKQDRIWMKMMVLLLFLMDTMNSVFDLVYLYDALVVKFGDVDNLAYANWVFSTDPAMTSIIASIVQMFFAWRVKILTKSAWLTALVVVCAIAGGLGGIATSIACGIVREFVQFRRFQVVVIIWLAAECLGDIVITSSLVWHLRRHKTGFQHTDDVIDRVIRLTVQTGMITAICAIVDLILFLLIPTGSHLIFNMPLSKLYTNSLMSSLNSRGGWNYGSTRSNGLSANSNINVQLKSPSAETKSFGTPEFKRVTGPEVFVHVESHEMVDTEKYATGDHVIAIQNWNHGNSSEPEVPLAAC